MWRMINDNVMGGISESYLWKSVNDNVMGGNSRANLLGDVWMGSLKPVDEYDLGFVSLNRPISIKNRTNYLEIYTHTITNEPRNIILQLNTKEYGYYKPAIEFTIYPNKNSYKLYLRNFKLFFRGDWQNYNLNNMYKNQINSLSLILSDNNPNYFEIFIGKIEQK